ncbi:unnamed protein product [Ectocarpus fasciculatus]
MYLHCWGGHGRTGTVVCIMLHLMYGLSADEAMERCQHVHDVRRIPISVGSPQTEAQRQQVRRVIGRVIAHRRSLVTPPPPAVTATSPARKQQQQRESSPSNGGGGGGISGAVLSPESSKKREAGGGTAAGAASASTVGGRRAWVRGRRQAFAQAPNGVGEEVSGWLDDENNEAEGDGLSDLQGGKKFKAGGAGQNSSHHHRHHRMPSTVSSEALSSSVGVAAAAAAAAAAASSSMPRRKSFTEPYSKDDPSRGTRMSRARRKSAPGKPPADVLAARAAAAAAAAGDAAAVAASSGKEDVCDVSTKSLLSLSPAKGINCRQTSSSKAVCSTPGDDAAASSPGSCTGVERCVTRSSGGGGGSGGTSCSAR